MSDLSQRLDEIEKRAVAAKLENFPPPDFEDARYAKISEGNGDYDYTIHEEFSFTNEDCAFLEHARTDVPMLLKMLRLALEQRNQAWRGYGEPFAKSFIEHQIELRDAEILKVMEGK